MARIPFPPPPADALTSAGSPMRSIAARTPASLWSCGVSPGTTGTPAAAARRRASIFDPMRSIAEGGGPTNTSPASAQARANAAFSERNPYPGCTASAPALRAASRIFGIDR